MAVPRNAEDLMTTSPPTSSSTRRPELYVGIVPGVPGAHTQAPSLDELRANLQEVLELCLEEQGELG